MFQPTDNVLDVTLLVLPDASLMSLAATLDPLRAANRISGRLCYRHKVVSLDGRDPTTSCGLTIRVDGRLEPTMRCDLFVVVAAFNVFEHATPALMQAVNLATRHAAFVGGIEAGPWILALAGLLDGRSATTHWEDLEAYAVRFPAVHTKADRWVFDGRFVTTGGAAPALDFLLSLIQARQGRKLSLAVASLYVYDGMRTGSQRQHAVSLGRLAWQEPRLAAAIKMMESHIEAPLTIATIALRIGTSRRTLETLFGKRAGASPAGFYMLLRLDAARRLIVDSDLSVADAAVRSGFSSSAALSRSFKRRFGHSPRAARRASL
ncbi:MAG: GlxA family transcriptional regulator [Aurantimonas endophytica]|uniref:GlxA family transcriptional regulator n=1 Tax=Aurantimonas endophytica TaxID=1522175 RepID=UPI003002676F